MTTSVNDWSSLSPLSSGSDAFCFHVFYRRSEQYRELLVSVRRQRRSGWRGQENDRSGRRRFRSRSNEPISIAQHYHQVPSRWHCPMRGWNCLYLRNSAMRWESGLSRWRWRRELPANWYKLLRLFRTNSLVLWECILLIVRNGRLKIANDCFCIIFVGFFDDLKLRPVL